MKILIIDDSYEIRDVLRLIIEKHGHEVYQAVDGQDGLEKARLHRPDLIITDAMMPRVDGFTFLRNIKKDPTLNSIPCVFYSATYTDSKDRELALSLGAEAFITKLKNPEEFWAEIKSILERKRQPVTHVDKRMIEDEGEFLKSYSQVVVAKLEKKVKELERVIAENNRIEIALRNSQEQLQSILDNTTTPIFLKDTEGRYLLINRQFEKALHVTKDLLIGKTDYDLFPHDKDKVDVLRMNDRKVIETKTPLTLEEVVPHDDGLHTYISVKFPIFDSSENLYGICCISTDITEHKRIEAELQKLSMVIEQSINIKFITDVKGHIEYVNPMFVHVTGYSKEEVIGQSPRLLGSGETSHTSYEELWRTILAGNTWRGVFKNKKKNGQYYWANGLISPIRNEKGQITHFLAIQEDITRKMQSEEKIKYLASYDELTDTLNRTRFTEVMNEWISYAKTSNTTGVILFIDNDNFRLINDTYGHSTGDNILKRMAKILQNTLSDIDTQYFKTSESIKEKMESILGRLGGDEFVILLPSRNKKEGLETAEEIRKRIEGFPFIEEAGHLTVTIGIVLYPEHGITIQDLFTKADASVYHAKELGRNQAHLYQPEDLILEKMQSRIAWKGRIQKAIKENRFEPWFQPILDLKNNTISHYEALARMRDGNGDIILPGAFIDVAETFGIIQDIDRIIIEKTMKFQSKLRKQGNPFFFSINLSGKDLTDVKILEFLKATITETGADPKRLIFEITETSAVHDLDRAVKFIRELRLIGCSFSLDDFGVGFTSFKYLKELWVDYIKIDGSFISRLHETQSDHIFVKAIADVARGMGIKTVAEFVENKEIVNYLKEYGVDYAQGYFIGKPSPDIQK